MKWWNMGNQCLDPITFVWTARPQLAPWTQFRPFLYTFHFRVALWCWIRRDNRQSCQKQQQNKTGPASVPQKSKSVGEPPLGTNRIGNQARLTNVFFRSTEKYYAFVLSHLGLCCMLNFVFQKHISIKCPATSYFFVPLFISLYPLNAQTDAWKQN